MECMSTRGKVFACVAVALKENGTNETNAPEVSNYLKQFGFDSEGREKIQKAMWWLKDNKYLDIRNIPDGEPVIEWGYVWIAKGRKGWRKVRRQPTKSVIVLTEKGKKHSEQYARALKNEKLT